MGNTERPTAGAVGTPPSEQDLLERVRAAWADVLDTDDADSIPLDANFLEVGGSSLLLIMLWEQLTETTGRELKVSDLFQHSSVRAQARLLAGGADRSTPAARGAHDRHRLIGRARRGGPGEAPARSSRDAGDEGAGHVQR